MWRREFFKFLSGVLLAPFVRRPSRMYRPCAPRYGPDQPLRMYVTDDPEYSFGFIGFKSADSEVCGQLLWRGNVEANVPRGVERMSRGFSDGADSH